MEAYGRPAAATCWRTLSSHEVTKKSHTKSVNLRVQPWIMISFEGVLALERAGVVSTFRIVYSARLQENCWDHTSPLQSRNSLEKRSYTWLILATVLVSVYMVTSSHHAKLPTQFSCITSSTECRHERAVCSCLHTHTNGSFFRTTPTHLENSHVTADSSISYFHHAKFQILLTPTLMNIHGENEGGRYRHLVPRVQN